jgi:hypothetical protein
MGLFNLNIYPEFTSIKILFSSFQQLESSALADPLSKLIIRLFDLKNSKYRLKSTKVISGVRSFQILNRFSDKFQGQSRDIFIKLMLIATPLKFTLQTLDAS